ncbi:MAG: hypothetical protein GY711_21225 [bacterium]|nr:hypothetical protein [bacterium]
MSNEPTSNSDGEERSSLREEGDQLRERRARRRARKRKSEERRKKAVEWTRNLWTKTMGALICAVLLYLTILGPESSRPFLTLVPATLSVFTAVVATTTMIRIDPGDHS